MGSLRRGEAAGSRRGVLVLLCTASFLAVADTTIVSIALPTIRQDLGFSVAGVQWVFNTYALVFGGLLLLLGRVGDLYGRRRLFIIGLVVFAAGSLAGGVAWEPYVLILARVLQGAGTAAFVPASLSLLTAAYPGYEERSRAIGLYGGMAGLGFVAGMVGGGAITQLWGWSWVFLVNVPIALLMLAPSTRVLKESWDESSTGRLDVGGALSVTTGMSLLVYAVTTGHERGWAAVGTVTATSGGLALLGVFLLIQRRHPAPLVPLGVVARSSVVTPNLAIALQSTVGISWLYVLTLYFQEVLGRGALEAGLLFAPMTLAGLLSATAAGPVVTRLGIRKAALGGLAFVALGLLVMMAGLGPGRPLPLLMVGMVAAEAGFMVSNVSLKVAGTTSIDDARGGLAAGLLNTSIQLGTACGLAVVTAVMSATRPEGVPPSDATAIALRWGLGACLAASVLAFLLATRLTSRYTSGRPSQEIGGRKDVSLATSAAARGSETGDHCISGSPGPSSPRRGGKT